MPSSQDSPRSFFTAPCRDMGIDALGRVTSQIVTEIQTLMSTPSPSAGKEYADLLHSLHTAFGKGLAIIGGLMNAAAPINRVPQELLTDIFALSPGTISHAGDTRELANWPFEEIDVSDLHKLTKVCRYWRDLAVATPMLWNTVCTYFEDDRDSPCFRRSIYLPDDPSPDLIVHFNPGRARAEKMIQFVVTNAPKIRELHAWSMYTIPDVPSFLRSLHAGALEHCTLWDTLWYRPRQPSPETRFLPFFSNGGARLRSLSLYNFDILPTNEFPALTLFAIASQFQSRITTGDLMKFLAGCARLEELYIYNIQRGPSHPSPASPPISLPRLQYLSYAYRRLQSFGWEEGADPIEYLLSCASIPSTCHIYFTVGDEEHCVTNRSILDSVCRHIRGKDAVSHLFLWLVDDRSSMQLVFSQGSLRLQFENQFDCVDILHSFPRLFSRTEEIRIRYISYIDLVRSLAKVLPATLPAIKVMSLIPEIEVWMDRDPAVHLWHSYLAQPPQSASPPVPETDRVPHPALDTLWISVRPNGEMAPLEATLTARAALGFPIRCVIVHLSWSTDSKALARLRALDAEEVILMETRASDVRAEVDWMRMPERFSLPAAIHRDWPTKWYRRELREEA